MSTHIEFVGVGSQDLVASGLREHVSSCHRCEGHAAWTRSREWHLAPAPGASGAVIQFGSRAAINQVLDRLETVIHSIGMTPSQAEYWMLLAKSAATRSGSTRYRVGAALVRDDELLAVGANEVPQATGGLIWSSTHGDEQERARSLSRKSYLNKIVEGDLIRSGGGADVRAAFQRAFDTHLSPLIDVDRAVHAEMAAVLSCARRGVQVDGSVMYTTTKPCYRCLRACAATGVAEVHYLDDRIDIPDATLRSELQSSVPVYAFSGLLWWNLTSELSN